MKDDLALAVSEFQHAIAETSDPAPPPEECVDEADLDVIRRCLVHHVALGGSNGLCCPFAHGATPEERIRHREMVRAEAIGFEVFDTQAGRITEIVWPVNSGGEWLSTVQYMEPDVGPKPKRLSGRDEDGVAWALRDAEARREAHRREKRARQKAQQRLHKREAYRLRATMPQDGRSARTA